VSGAGDVDGDGLDDLIVGALNAFQSYVVFGKADAAPVELADVAAGQGGGFALNGASGGGGYSVSGAGDVDGDGLDDLIVGAPRADPNGRYSGQSYVVFGKADAAAVDLSEIAAGRGGGFALNGVAERDISGFSVSGAGDVDGDDFDDVIIGAPRADPNGVYNAGQSYVVFSGDFLFA
jgi:FG-GAP repeat